MTTFGPQNHYKHLSIAFGKETKPDEEFVNNLGYEFMKTQQFKKSEDFFFFRIELTFAPPITAHARPTRTSVSS